MGKGIYVEEIYTPNLLMKDENIKNIFCGSSHVLILVKIKKKKNFKKKKKKKKKL